MSERINVLVLKYVDLVCFLPFKMHCFLITREQGCFSTQNFIKEYYFILSVNAEKDSRWFSNKPVKNLIKLKCKLDIQMLQSLLKNLSANYNFNCTLFCVTKIKFRTLVLSRQWLVSLSYIPGPHNFKK